MFYKEYRRQRDKKVCELGKFESLGTIAQRFALDVSVVRRILEKNKVERLINKEETKKVKETNPKESNPKEIKVPILNVRKNEDNSFFTAKGSRKRKELLYLIKSEKTKEASQLSNNIYL